MFLDLNALDEGHELRADIVVVGAGAAGITLALALAGSGLEVLLVESGGFDLDADTQALYEGEVVGMAYEPLVAARGRYFGGTTNLWSGWCKPLDGIDFRPRPWLGLSGWPIGRDELQPYYERAQPIVEAGSYRYDRRLWGEIGAPLHAFDPGLLALTFWQKSPPTRFGQRYRDELARAGNVKALLGANLVEMALAEGGQRLEAITLASLAGRRARATARAYVLACGGIENARLLLAACPARPGGLGNDGGFVGRCFMDHPQFDVGRIHAADPYAFVDSYYRRVVAGRPHRIGWALGEAAQARLGVANCVAELAVTPDKGSAAHVLSGLWGELRRGHIPPHLGEKALAVLRDIGGLVESAWRKEVLHTRVNKPIAEICLLVTLDPAPNPESRVTLGRERDALGLPEVELRWQLTAADERGMAALARSVAAELARLGLARVQLHPALADAEGGWARAGNLVGHGIAPEAPEMHISWHHMGTTRMAASPRQGVVDADCRVHGLANLYVAGSSVFPTTGNANPTLTIVALALRLADRLRHELAA